MPKEQPRIEKIVERGTNYAVFRFNKDAVWAALVEAITDANIHPQSMDKDSGAILFNTDATWGQNWGDTNLAVIRMTTKKVKGRSAWQALAVSGNVFCKALDETRTQVKANFRFLGFNGFSQWLGGSGWQWLDSNGYLEGQIFDALAQRLPDEPALLVLPAKESSLRGDPVVVEHARRVLSLIEKIDAAFDLGGTRDEIMPLLVDALTAARQFNASENGPLLPLFGVVVQEATTLYRDSLSGEEKAKTLATARQKLAAARTYLHNFREFGQEPTPKK